MTALGVLWGALRAVRTNQSVSRLAASLDVAPAPGTLGVTLARWFGDPRLTVAYWSDSTQSYVDPSGHAVDPVPARSQVATPIVRRDAPVAVIVHDRSLLAEHDLAAELGAAARLVVDNERYRADILAQLADLRASQARIVATADGTRRQLERDLHDGAQQRLLAVLYELRRAAAHADGDAEVGAQ